MLLYAHALQDNEQKRGIYMERSHSTDPCIGHRIRDARKAKGFSQEALASELNVSVNYIGQLERGERPVSLNMATKLCHFFQLTLDYLYRGDLPIPHPNSVIQEIDPHREIQYLMNSCSEQELQLCLNILKPMLVCLRASCDPTKPKGKADSKPFWAEHRHKS